jgi:hypothetical protein
MEVQWAEPDETVSLGSITLAFCGLLGATIQSELRNETDLGKSVYWWLDGTSWPSESWISLFPGRKPFDLMVMNQSHDWPLSSVRDEVCKSVSSVAGVGFPRAPSAACSPYCCRRSRGLLPFPQRPDLRPSRCHRRCFTGPGSPAILLLVRSRPRRRLGLG